jgi:hypothetical protein
MPPDSAIDQVTTQSLLHGARLPVPEIAQEIERRAQHAVGNENRDPPFRDRIGGNRGDALVELAQRFVGADPGREHAGGSTRCPDEVMEIAGHREETSGLAKLVGAEKS